LSTDLTDGTDEMDGTDEVDGTDVVWWEQGLLS